MRETRVCSRYGVFMASLSHWKLTLVPTETNLWESYGPPQPGWATRGIFRYIRKLTCRTVKLIC